MSACGCTTSVYNFGTEIRFAVDFTNAVTGALQDPTDIKLAIKYEGYGATIYTYLLNQVQKAAVGQYTYDYTPASGGSYSYAWQGIGAVIASTGDIPFTVADNLFG